MTTANQITIGRILLVPVFVAELLLYGRTGANEHRLGALLAFAAASVADAADGWVARRFNQRTELGAVLDPLADKILLTSALLIFTLEHRLPPWLLGTVLARELIILAGMFLVRGRAGRVRVQAHPTGKIATALLMAIVLWILLKLDGSVVPWLAAGAGVLTACSAFFYILDGVRQFYSHPQAGGNAS